MIWTAASEVDEGNDDSAAIINTQELEMMILLVINRNIVNNKKICLFILILNCLYRRFIMLNDEEWYQYMYCMWDTSFRYNMTINYVFILCTCLFTRKKLSWSCIQSRQFCTLHGNDTKIMDLDWHFRYRNTKVYEHEITQTRNYTDQFSVGFGFTLRYMTRNKNIWNK